MPEIIPMPLMSGVITPQTTPISQKMGLTASPKAEPDKPVEEPKEEPKITAETSPQDAMRIAASIRREKLLRKQSKELEEQRKQFREEQESLKPWQNAKEVAKKSKLEALKALGFTYEDLTNEMLSGGALAPEVVAKQTAEEIITQRMAEYEKKQQDRATAEQQANYQAALKQIDSEVQGIADTSEKYLLVKEASAYHDVTEYIEKEFHRTGVIMPVEAALDKVEQDILEGLQAFTKIEKIKALFLPKEEPKIETPPAPQTNQKITTLTHKSTVAPSAARSLTQAERRARAIAIASGQTV